MELQLQDAKRAEQKALEDKQESDKQRAQLELFNAQLAKASKEEVERARTQAQEALQQRASTIGDLQQLRGHNATLAAEGQRLANSETELQKRINDQSEMHAEEVTKI